MDKRCINLQRVTKGDDYEDKHVLTKCYGGHRPVHGTWEAKKIEGPWIHGLNKGGKGRKASPK